MTNLLSLILLECTFLGNFRVNGLFLLFLPKALFGFLEQVNFIEIYYIVSSFIKVKMSCFLSFKQVSYVGEEDRDCLKGDPYPKPRSPCSF